MANLKSLVQSLSELGYPNLTIADDHIDGVVSGIDLSNASRSPPQGDDTGPFATLDNPESHIPDDILKTCRVSNANVTVLGSGGFSKESHLHLYIKLPE